MFVMLLIRLIPRVTVFYIIFWDALQSPDAFYQVPSSLVLYDEIQYLTEAIPVFGEFLCLHIVLYLFDGPGESSWGLKGVPEDDVENDGSGDESNEEQ